MGSFVQIDGARLVRDGRELRLRGVNLGNWMLIEHYMLGLPWTEYKMREAFLDRLGRDAYEAFFGTFMEASCSDADLAFLQSHGFNFVRLPINYRWFGSDRTCRAFGDGFAHVDRFLDLARQHGVCVLLDLHAAPGVQARDWNSESLYGEAFLWDHDAFREETARIWRLIAARYRDDDAVMGYDVLGEPLTDDLDVLHAFTMRMIAAIRSVDPNHVIVVEGNRWGQDVASLRDEVFADPQVTYSPHFYPTSKKPFDRLAAYPGRFNGRTYGRDELIGLLDGYYDEQRIRRPVVVGEFGVGVFGVSDFDESRPSVEIGQDEGGEGHPTRKARLAILRDAVALFEERGWSWAWWAHKDVGHMGLLRPRADTPWRRFLDDPRVRRYGEAFERHATAMNHALAADLPELNEQELFLLRYGARHHWHATILPYVVDLLRGRSCEELAEMARSFAFENCEVDADRLGVLTDAF